MKNSMNISTAKRLLGYATKAKPIIFASSLCAIIYSALSMVIPYFAGKSIDLIVGKGEVDFGMLKNYLFVIGGVIVLASVCQLIFSIINNQLSFDIICRIRNDAYGKIRRLPISYIDKTSIGSVQSMIINDSETIGDGVLLFLNQFFSGIVAIITTLVVMLSIDWKIALFVLVFTPVSFLVSYFIASRSYSSFKKQSSIRATQTSYIDEMSSNFRVIHLYNTGENVCEDFQKINDDYRKTATKASFLSSITNPSTRFVNALIYAGVAFIGSRSVIAGAITVGALSALLSYSSQFMKPFNDLSAVYTEMSDAFACLDRIFKFIDEPEMDNVISEDLETVEDGLWNPNGDFKIEFRDVTFSYDGVTPVLKNVSFTVYPGQSCAIVGPTGCGKTTLINLLLRFYEPQSGEILVNDVPISSVPRNVLRSYIGVVSQDTWFKNGEILENLKFGNKDTTDDSAIKASQISGADSFIRKLPKKYHETIDVSRDDISEGQRQLLSITRALVSNRSMLILDEATSSVDVLTEVKIQNAVKELLEGRTSIIIAHRLSTIIDADIIVVLESGKLSEIGKHDELIKNQGFYSKLYKSYTE